MAHTHWQVLDDAHHALRTAVAGVPADAWQSPTPCAEWNVAQVLQHAAGDQLAYAAKLTDGPGPAYDPFAPSGSLDGEPADLLEPALSATASAFAGVDPAAEQVPVPLPPFSVSADVAAGAAALDAAVHAWDIAAATGQPSPLSPELASRLRPVADAIAEPLRGFAFGAPVDTADDADDAAALLGYLGRRADWTP